MIIRQNIFDICMIYIDFKNILVIIIKLILVIFLKYMNELITSVKLYIYNFLYILQMI